MEYSQDTSLIKEQQKGLRVKEQSNNSASLLASVSGLSPFRLPRINNVSDQVLNRLYLISAMMFVFLLLQIAGGLLAGSLAILSDAAHMFCDLAGFAMQIFALFLSRKAASDTMTFGYHRAEVIGAISSIVLIWNLLIVLVVFATLRIVKQERVTDPLIMLITAGTGLVLNILMAVILLRPPTDEYNQDIKKSLVHSVNEDPQEQIEDGRNQKVGKVNHSSVPQNNNLTQVQGSEQMNLRAAVINVIGDTLQSLGVVLSALLIYFFGDTEQFTYWDYADPICSYCFGVLVLLTTFGVSIDCINVLMEGTPEGIVLKDIKDKISEIPKLREIHDFHVWTISVGKPSLSAHIVVEPGQEAKILRKVTKICREFGIYHSTIQVEDASKIGTQDYIQCEHNIH